MKTVEVVEIGPFAREIWRFWYKDDEHTLRLSGYIKEERATLRHTFKAVAVYEQHRRRGDSLAPPDIPEAIARSAVETFFKGLTVSRWEK